LTPLTGEHARAGRKQLRKRQESVLIKGQSADPARPKWTLKVSFRCLGWAGNCQRSRDKLATSAGWQCIVPSSLRLPHRLPFSAPTTKASSVLMSGSEASPNINLAVLNGEKKSIKHENMKTCLEPKVICVLLRSCPALLAAWISAALSFSPRLPTRNRQRPGTYVGDRDRVRAGKRKAAVSGGLGEKLGSQSGMAAAVAVRVEGISGAILHHVPDVAAAKIPVYFTPSYANHSSQLYQR
jgi:hypothetical protein